MLDEATGGLDPIVRDEVLEIFNEFTREEDHSILISSHIVSDLEKLCDYIAFLHQGRLLFCQEKDQLLEDYGVFVGTAEQAESLLAQAREEAENIRREAVAAAEAEKEQIRETARKQGHNEGLTQAKAQAEAQVEAVKKEYQVKEKQLEAFYQQQLQELEPRLVDAITEIYQHFFHVELSSYRDILTYLITAAMRKADGSRSFTIRVSREDYPYVSMQKKQIITEGGAGSCAVEVTEDMSLEKNECLIETDGGIFDCGLGTQLAELKQKLALLSWSRE